MDTGIARGVLQELIVVMPDADKTCHYTDSPVKGGWATFVARDLVAEIDRRYRTVAHARGRALLGHSMGGHGALKIPMTHPGIFSAAYAMNPSMLGWGGDVAEPNPGLASLNALRDLGAVERENFYVQAVVGIGQCFSPDAAAPLRMRSPFGATAGADESVRAARAQWDSQMPVSMARHHAPALKALRGLRFDSAFEDEFTHIPTTTRALSAALDSLGVDHTFEMYNGDHRNRLWGERGRLFATALPYLSGLLDAASGTTAATPADVPAPRPAAPPAPTRVNPAVQEALWSAARAGNTRRADEALRQGADINALDSTSAEAGASGRRALHYAALFNQQGMVKWLVERGATVNATNRTGFTPLHHAAEKGSYQAAQALLAAGADANAKLPSGSTPLSVARQRKQDLLVRLLEPVTRTP